MKQFFDLNEFLDHAWALLTRGVVDKKSVAKNPTFSTISEDGFPTMRTVVLRRADRIENCLEIHTDIQTNKVSSLRKNNCAGLHFWVPKAKFQIRASVVVDILTGSKVEGEWNKIPVRSRVSYGSTPCPGIAINSPFEYQKVPEQDNFAVLRCYIRELDLLYLGDIHQRAIHRRGDPWTSTWVAP
jgi:pyridoxine/pyridoxamine 5'-phosphate oxidase